MYRYTNPDEIIRAIQSGQARRQVSADTSIVSRRRPQARPEQEEDPVEQNKQMIKDYLEMIGLSPEPTEATPQAPETSLRPKGRYEIPDGEVQSYVYQGLIERGLPEHVAKGFMMNFQDESGFNVSIEEAEPNVHGTRGKGIYQLTGARREAFEKKYGNDYSVDNQLDFLVDELSTTEKNAFEKIMNTETAGEAGASIVKHFLRPAKKHELARAKRYLSSSGYTPKES